MQQKLEIPPDAIMLPAQVCRDNSTGFAESTPGELGQSTRVQERPDEDESSILAWGNEGNPNCDEDFQEHLAESGEQTSITA